MNNLNQTKLSTAIKATTNWTLSTETIMSIEFGAVLNIPGWLKGILGVVITAVSMAVPVYMLHSAVAAAYASGLAGAAAITQALKSLGILGSLTGLPLGTLLGGPIVLIAVAVLTGAGLCCLSLGIAKVLTERKQRKVDNIRRTFNLYMTELKTDIVSLEDNVDGADLMARVQNVTSCLYAMDALLRGERFIHNQEKIRADLVMTNGPLELFAELCDDLEEGE